MSREVPPSRTAPQFVVRLPDEEFRTRIAEAAKSNNRSMNAEIVARLESSFEEEKRSLSTEAFLAELGSDAAVQRANIEKLVQERGALGYGVRILHDFLEAGRVPTDSANQKLLEKILDDADAAIEAASNAMPHQAILDLKAAMAHVWELAEAFRTRDGALDAEQIAKPTEPDPKT